MRSSCTIKFHNILDRGYRGKWAACQSGGRQIYLQPPSSKSDRRFKGNNRQYLPAALPMIELEMKEPSMFASVLG